MEVVVSSRVVAGRAVAVGKLDGQVAGHERLERLVYRGEGDVGDLGTDGGEDLVGRWVVDGAAEKTEDGRPLFGEALAVHLQGASQHFVRVFRGRLGGKAHESRAGQDGPFPRGSRWEQVASIETVGS